MSQSKTDVVIVGCGIYGMSTALWMLQSGKYNVTMLDKCGILPAPDAASTDLNKIVRTADYADASYAELGLDAVENFWRKPEWEGTYHESGVIALAAETEKEGLEFVSSAYQNCKNLGINVTLLNNSKDIKSKFDPEIRTGDFGGRQGYLNPIGGWAEAGRALEVGLKRVRQLGGHVRSGAEVTGLIKDGRNVKGVTLKSGEDVRGDLVVIAAGAWTPALCALPGVSARLPDVVATGQSVAVIQLTPEEAKQYASVPVVFNLDDGWYIFPPNPEGLVKMAIHGAGVLNPQSNGVSIPRTKLTAGAEDGAIPLSSLKGLRDGLRQVYPELAKKDYLTTRLCWYCDTVTGDWLIDYHPDFDNLVIASGDSGHGFKFTPNIGREILKVIEKNPSPQYAEKWSFGYTAKAIKEEGSKAAVMDVSKEEAEMAKAGADVRAGKRKVLKESDLVKPHDLKAKNSKL
ncbi:sarcosine oxidase [Kwoniella mangroviensis CBS 10435]|uniref:Sarcosine oxidase n=1 Tax=Kwoniella mangroviensis CBS 10435 TaxID=1331196 RepID=A0A1B9J007_9TREE|nr:sarcosine oxidase [Kwoniella mangroviensis CBS 10435]OCF74248.1 sarcosine oxidase [Kwoniella mangroviensis CBS 8886]